MAYDPAKPYANKMDPQGSGSPYDYLRNKATQDAGNQQAQGLDAITRRYAAMGNLNSGAYTKAIEDNSRTAANASQNAQGQIDMAENAQALPYAQLAQQGSQFSQSLSAQLSEAEKTRGQQESQYGRTLGEQQSEFGQEMPLKQQQLDLEARQQNIDKEANNINERLGTYQAHHSGGLLGGGGFLGSGLGNGGK